MQSMMAPSIALDADGPALAIGAAGGTRLRTALVGVASAVLDEGVEPQEAVDRPRVHRAGTTVNAEPGVDEGALAELERRGLTVRRWPDAAPLLRRRQPGRSDRAGCRSTAERLGTPAASAAGHRGSSLSLPCRGARARSRRLDVAGDLVDQRLLALEHLLVAEALPQLDDQALAVQVAGEAEQEGLDPQLVAAVVRVRPDRDRGAVTGRRSPRRCRAAGRAARGRRRRSRSGSRACRRARRPRRPSPRPRAAGRAARRPRRRGPRGAGGGSPTRTRPRAAAPAGTSKPRPRSSVEIAAPPVAEPEVLAGDHDLGADRAQVLLGEVLRLDPLRLERELDDERLLDARARRRARAAARAWQSCSTA